MRTAIQKQTAATTEAADLKRQSRELRSRLGRLYADLGRWIGAPTKDQLSELKFYSEMVQKLTAAGR